ncbi:cytochrome c oxidase subunit II [Alphaproteobacteria bacterium GH1-50]|uniref:Cytochrome c oxidase subunit 2 n=1 Tax=Kangsaoukella pontilimi TaxID=2691042 RepID=A0A7C9IJA6_9RHOB|nr:cytochrome c oxidase subunit II [Kangsaoukella pontilimi]MXQ08762.1 cytochrome c oxidase subunit II [Kangsaoukella pontilimi]
MRLSTVSTRLAAALAGLTATVTAAAAQGLPVVGAPTEGGIGFQPAATELARDLQWLDGMLLVIITIITLFVLALIVAVIVRYNSRANPEPATFTHNTPVEVAWTVVPIVILVFIGAFSLPVLFKQQEIPEGDVIVKVTGYQWYWGYEYIDEEIAFESYMIDGSYKINDEAAGFGDDQELTAPQVFNDEAVARLEYFGYGPEAFLLATDTAVVVPTGKTVVMQVTGADVIHSWTIPAFGVKQDAVPGRLAELWFEVEEGMEGVYFGQCSELCGISHAYMPITVIAVTDAEYQTWLDEARAAIEAGEIVPKPAALKLASAN